MSLQDERRVREIMSTPLETISRNGTVSEAAEKMRTEEINALVVTTGPPSIVTSTDILTAVAEERDTASMSVTEITTESVETIPPTVQTSEAAAMMESLGINHLPVREGGDFVGMVSSTDVAAALS